MKTVLLAIFAFTIAGTALAQTAAPAKHKVVLQMNVADNDAEVSETTPKKAKVPKKRSGAKAE